MGIGMMIINPFDDEESIEQMKKEHGFDLRKDLKNVNLTKEEFTKFIQDLYIAFTATPIKGKKLASSDQLSVYKTRHNDDNRNIGTSGAYRLLSMYNCRVNKVYPFHLYHKKSGRNPKNDLTPKEKKEIKRMVIE